uniref:Uncharacterized protein n=1 Tax=Vitrella brassicaformis TaxID=1169539 RepID=A0A7S1JSE0_9ALVE
MGVFCSREDLSDHEQQTLLCLARDDVDPPTAYRLVDCPADNPKKGHPGIWQIEKTPNIWTMKAGQQGCLTYTGNGEAAGLEISTECGRNPSQSNPTFQNIWAILPGAGCTEIMEKFKNNKNEDTTRVCKYRFRNMNGMCLGMLSKNLTDTISYELQMRQCDYRPKDYSLEKRHRFKREIWNDEWDVAYMSECVDKVKNHFFRLMKRTAQDGFKCLEPLNESPYFGIVDCWDDAGQNKNILKKSDCPSKCWKLEKFENAIQHMTAFETENKQTTDTKNEESAEG